MTNRAPRYRAANTVFSPESLWALDPKAAFQEWLIKTAFEDGYDFGKRTISVYVAMWATAIAYLQEHRSTHPTAANTADIEQFLNQAHVCRRVEARQRYTLLLRRAYGAMHQAAPKFANPMDMHFRPITAHLDEKPMPFLLADERARVFQLISKDDPANDLTSRLRIRAKAMCALMLGAGFKPGQANITSVNCVINKGERFIMAPETGAMPQHLALVYPAAWPAIHRWIELYGSPRWMFPGAGSHVEQPINYARAFLGAKELLAELGPLAGGERVSPQTLRNSYGASLLEDGLGIEAVREYMGFSRMEYARRFAHAHAAWRKRIDN
ncbi:tyrosine-type recombinase/integrase [Janthinobacterium sp. PSPC3-1]|uniref:tyrosine-type recombinase/integrase n=1 Tax=Janthinobacterium sp. PSPC3-1 TaxID=2804653 RepID=UPI003CE81209